MLTSLYFFSKKENGIWEKDVLFDTKDDPTDVVAAIEEFSNINKDHSVSALNDLVKKMMTEIYVLIKVSNVCDISGKICLEWGWRINECLTSGCTIAALYPAYYRLIIKSINTHGQRING